MEGELFIIYTTLSVSSKRWLNCPVPSFLIKTRQEWKANLLSNAEVILIATRTLGGIILVRGG